MPEATYKVAEVYGISRDIPRTYQERVDVDDKLIDNLTRDKHVVIFGSSKQGKTCLRLHCLNDDDYIVVQCQSNWTMDQVGAAILKNVGSIVRHSMISNGQ